MSYCIFKIINKVNNKSFICSSINDNRTAKIYMRLLKKGEHSNENLQNDFNKYGESNFEIAVLEENVKFKDVESIKNKYFKLYEDNLYNIYKDTRRRRGETREVLMIELETFKIVGTYNSILDASKKTGLPFSGVRYCIIEGRVTDGKMFVYADEYNEWFCHKLPEKKFTAHYDIFGYLLKITNNADDFKKGIKYYKHIRDKLNNLKFYIGVNNKIIIKCNKIGEVSYVYKSSKETREDNDIKTRQRFHQIVNRKPTKEGYMLYRFDKYCELFGDSEVRRFYA